MQVPMSTPVLPCAVSLICLVAARLPDQPEGPRGWGIFLPLSLSLSLQDRPPAIVKLTDFFPYFNFFIVVQVTVSIVGA